MSSIATEQFPGPHNKANFLEARKPSGHARRMAKAAFIEDLRALHGSEYVVHAVKRAAARRLGENAVQRDFSPLETGYGIKHFNEQEQINPDGADWHLDPDTHLESK